ncbi:hypothetical protein RHGRI_006853 [Rhododendron griersonianum]|uniref:Uncharacterized protein n=1 Tax=Rhododendron griersonianum TaxID=479676 RepID=A0AAV6KV58_9ERIC|nr:hypothetical protein RHGRI_006853 [Rhododendron griersonianum]
MWCCLQSGRGRFRVLDIGRLNKLSLLVVDKLKELEERKVEPHQLAAPPPLSLLAPPPLPLEMGGVEDLGSSVKPTWIQEFMNGKWFMETMALYQQDIPCGPSWVASDFEIMSSEHRVAGSISGGKNEKELI